MRIRNVVAVGVLSFSTGAAPFMAYHANEVAQWLSHDMANELQGCGAPEATVYIGGSSTPGLCDPSVASNDHFEIQAYSYARDALILGSVATGMFSVSFAMDDLRREAGQQRRRSRRLGRHARCR